MLELRLEELFGHEQLIAFRKRWATDPQIAGEDAKDIVRMLTDPVGREAEVARLVLLMVGEKPDFNAWMESFAVGSFELRENVRYAHHGRRGMQPARFFHDQQKRIERIASEDLTEAEAEEWRNAYEDAMRLIIATQVLKEMRMGVAAKAALSIAWPLMVAVTDKGFGVRQRKLLALFSKEPRFIDFLRDRLAGILDDWVDKELDGLEPSTRNLREASLFHEPSEEEARAILQPAETYRSHLLEGLDLKEMTAGPSAGFDLEPKDQAAKDAQALALHVQTGIPRSWEEFSEFTCPPEPFDYSEDSIENLRQILPILAGERKASRLFQAAAERGLARSQLLDGSNELKSASLVGRIHRWVQSGATPPPDLNLLHAAVYEDAVCSFLVHSEQNLEEAWIEFGFPEANARVSISQDMF